RVVTRRDAWSQSTQAVRFDDSLEFYAKVDESTLSVHRTADGVELARFFRLALRDAASFLTSLAVLVGVLSGPHCVARWWALRNGQPRLVREEKNVAGFDFSPSGRLAAVSGNGRV